MRCFLGNRTIPVSLNAATLLVAALIVHMIAAQTVIVLPGFVQGLIHYRGFSDRQAGLIASAETSGMALATVALMVLARRISWRVTCLASLLLLIVGNLAAAIIGEFSLFALVRFVIGIGAGVLISLTYGVIGMTERSDRNFGICIMVVLTYGSCVFPTMPFLYAHIGLMGLLLLFAGLAACGLPFVRYLPDSAAVHSDTDTLPTDAVNVGTRLKVMALGSVLIYFVANFSVWSYFWRIGVSAGIAEQQASNSLGISQLFGIAGAFTTALVGTRLGRPLPLAVGLLGSMACIACLLVPMGPLAFGVIAALYNYVWNMTHPYLLGTMASLDRKGGMVVYAVAMQYIGISLGPASAALVVGKDRYEHVITLGLAGFAVCLMLILPPVLTQARVAAARNLRAPPQRHN